MPCLVPPPLNAHVCNQFIIVNTHIINLIIYELKHLYFEKNLLKIFFDLSAFEMYKVFNEHV